MKNILILSLLLVGIIACSTGDDVIVQGDIKEYDDSTINYSGKWESQSKLTVTGFNSYYFLAIKIYEDGGFIGEYAGYVCRDTAGNQVLCSKQADTVSECNGYFDFVNRVGIIFDSSNNSSTFRIIQLSDSLIELEMISGGFMTMKRAIMYKQGVI